MMRVNGLGNLVKDPELRELENTCVVNLTVATNEYRKTGNDEMQKTAHFFDLEAWDTAARTLVERAKKGSLICFTGKLRQHRWDDKDSGQKRSRVVIRVDEFRIIPTGKSAGAEDTSVTEDVDSAPIEEESPF